jgi:adenylate cyclase
MRVRFPGGDAIEIEVGRGESVAGAAGRAGDAGGVVHGPCRGHGRCGMCVVAIAGGADGVSAADEAEARVLRILQAAPDQRLACQARGR